MAPFLTYEIGFEQMNANRILRYFEAIEIIGPFKDL